MCVVHLKVHREKYCSFVLYLYEQRERRRSIGKVMGYGIHEHCSLLRRGRKLSVLYQVQAPLGSTHLRCPGMELYILNQLSTPTNLPIQMSPSYRKLSPKHPYTTPTRSFTSNPNPPLYMPTLRTIFHAMLYAHKPPSSRTKEITQQKIFVVKTLNIYTNTLNTFSYKCYQP